MRTGPATSGAGLEIPKILMGVSEVLVVSEHVDSTGALARQALGIGTGIGTSFLAFLAWCFLQWSWLIPLVCFKKPWREQKTLVKDRPSHGLVQVESQARRADQSGQCQFMPL